MKEKTQKLSRVARRDKQQIFSIRKFSIGAASVAIAAFWGTNATTSAASAEEVGVKHVALSSLSDGERGLIKSGTPTIAEQDLACNYILVYRPATSQTVSAGAKTKPSKPTILPSTGSVETDLALYGLGLAGLAGYLLYKDKKTGRHFLVAVVIAGGAFTAATAQAEWNFISQSEVVYIEADGHFVVTPKVIEGYEYIGYIEDESCKLVPVPAEEVK